MPVKTDGLAVHPEIGGGVVIVGYYKASTAIDAAIKKIVGSHGTSLKTALYIWMDSWQGVDGKFQKGAAKSVPADKGGVVAVANGKADSSLPRVLTMSDAKTIARDIDRLAIGSDHLDVKTNARWLAIYRKQARQVPFMNTAGNVVNKNLDTIPCHNCGMVLPLSAVQVDHHMPQTGGEDLYTLKMARALGLTASGPTGGKGSAVAAGNLAALTVNPKGRATGDYNHLSVATPKAKWTTDDRGSAFFSLAAYVGALDDIKRICKNTVLNLVPLCGDCNRVKSDWIKPIN